MSFYRSLARPSPPLVAESEEAKLRREYEAWQQKPPRRWNDLRWRERWPNDREKQALIRLDDGTVVSVVGIISWAEEAKGVTKPKRFEIRLPTSRLDESYPRGDAGAMMRILNKLERAHKMTRHSQTR